MFTGIVEERGTVASVEPLTNAERIAITVNGGISTSTEIGKAVYDSLIQYKQVYGPLRGFD